MRAKKEKLLTDLGITSFFGKSAWAKIVKSKLAKPLQTGSEALFEFSDADLEEMRELCRAEIRRSGIQQAGPRPEKSLVGHKNQFNHERHKNQFDHERDYKPSSARAEYQPPKRSGLLSKADYQKLEALERKGNIKFMGIVR